MRGFIFSVLLIIFAAFSAADIKIVYPSAKFYWTYGINQNIIWTSNSSDPSPFNVYLKNSQISTLNTGTGLALLNNVATQQSSTNYTLPQNYGLTNATDGFVLCFSSPSNSSVIYATSEVFSIMPNGTTPSVYTPPSTATPTSSSGASTNGTAKSAAGTFLPYKHISFFISVAVISFMFII